MESLKNNCCCGLIETELYKKYNKIWSRSSKLNVLPSINNFDDTKFLRHQILDNIRGF